MDHAPTEQPKPACFLAGTLPDGKRFRFVLEGGRFTVGRLPANQVQLKHETVSGIHAEFVRLGHGRFRVRNLDSMNGVFVNGVPVADKEIAAPCRVLIGGVACDLEADPPLADPPRPCVSRSCAPVPAPGSDRPKRTGKAARRRRVRRLAVKSVVLFAAAILVGGWGWSFTRSPEHGATPQSAHGSEVVALVEGTPQPEPAPLLVVNEVPASADEPTPAEAGLSEISAGQAPVVETESNAPDQPSAPASDTELLFAAATTAEPWFARTVAMWAARELTLEAALRVRVKPPEKEPAPQPPPAPHDLTVLILGDSLSLCGFGKRLDSRFRETPQIKATYTYMACGTVPLSWLKTGSYAHARSCCGFWSIESVAGEEKPRVVQDTYGIKRGYRPKAHSVPKIEDLLAMTKPDILIVQTGTNLFGLFPDCKTVNADRHDAMLKNHIEPFFAQLMKSQSSLRKVYWIGSPVSGRVSDQVQDFVVERYRKFAGDTATVIDSRTLITYPYSGLQHDKEHFMGADMDRWADKVFDQVMHDINTGALPPPLVPAVAAESEPVAESANGKPLEVKAKLVFKSPPLRTEQILPYQESLVAYVYDVLEVVEGEYQEKQILVMHPAHIRLQAQTLGKYRIGKTYDLKLRDMDNTPWVSIKSSDQSGRVELLPFIQVADEAKYPSRGE